MKNNPSKTQIKIIVNITEQREQDKSPTPLGQKPLDKKPSPQ